MPYRRENSPYWWVCITPPNGGKAIRKSTGTLDRREAKALEGKWRSELFKQSAWGTKPPRIFADVAAEFLLASQSKRSLNDIKLRVARLYDHFGAEFVMDQMTGQDVRGFIAWRQTMEVKPATINRELDMLSAMINHAIIHLEWPLPNPVRGRKLEEPEGRVRWITKAEAARLIQCARQLRSGDRLADFIELALHTGCRMNELLRLDWCRVDWANELIILEAEHSKTNRRRTVPLNAVALHALKRRASYVAGHCPSSPWVFCGRNGARLVAIREGFKSACENAGIRDSGFGISESTIYGTPAPAGLSVKVCR